MEKEIKIEMDKSLAEQNLPCCKNCGYIEAEYCKFHFKTIDDIENTLCTEYELNH